MFVDPHHIVVMLGTSFQGDVYNPLAVRWCDREDLTNWSATPSNFAGDYLLAVGGKAVSGLATRQQNAIWTDTALYTQWRSRATRPPSSRSTSSAPAAALPGRLAADEQNGAVFWASRDNFFIFQGAAPQPIPCPLRRDFFEHIADGQEDKISAGLTPALARFGGSIRTRGTATSAPGTSPSTTRKIIGPAEPSTAPPSSPAASSLPDHARHRWRGLLP
jgi:hypothetical protein